MIFLQYSDFKLPEQAITMLDYCSQTKIVFRESGSLNLEKTKILSGFGGILKISPSLK